jgi:hypothetical protein
LNLPRGRQEVCADLTSRRILEYRVRDTDAGTVAVGRTSKSLVLPFLQLGMQPEEPTRGNDEYGDGDEIFNY